ncbi:uncharacterized protein LOC128983229 isoform X2 [Macrosteles quadrilineatus]|uniref:uncharacterized protein LOC128983229 isoform X2 n=1 Tax=Macrosteles quadrilineatus TaxID=74068 RepID=UPI0023E0C23A|nr:uncharacterized protein LOC128983229 isoform X2 [Macrosteles quadrilineatus]
MGEITMIKTEETTKPISVEIVKDEITLHLTDTVEIVSEHEAKTITPLDDSSIVKTVDTVTTKFIEKSEDTSTDVHLETKEPVVVEDIKSTKDTKSDEKAKDTDYLEEEVLAATESLTKVIEVNDAQKQITEEDIISKHLPIDKLDVLEIVDFKTNEEMVKGQSKDGVALEEEHVHDMTELLEPIDMDTVSEITIIKTEETTTPISVEIVKDEITTHVTDTVEIVSEHEAKTITPVDDSSIVKTVDKVTTKVIEESEDTSTDDHLKTKEPVSIEDIKSTKDTKSVEEAKDTDSFEEEVLADTESPTKVIEADDAPKHITKEDIINKHLPIDKLESLEIVGSKTTEEMVKDQSKEGVPLEEEHVHDMTDLFEPIARDTVSEITIMNTEGTTTPISLEIVKDEITTHVTDTVEIVSEHKAKTVTAVYDSSIVKTVDTVNTKVIEESEYTSTDVHLELKEPVPVEDIKFTKDTKSDEEAKDTDSLEEEVLADTESPKIVIEADDAPKQITEEDIISKHLPMDKLESLEIVGFKTTEEMVKDQSKDGAALEEEHVHDMTEIVKDEITTHVTDTVEIVSKHKAETNTSDTEEKKEATPVYDVDDSSIVKTTTKVIEESDNTTTDFHLETKDPVAVEDIKSAIDVDETKDTDFLEEELFADSETLTKVIEADDASKQITEEDIISKHLPVDKLKSLEIEGFKTTEEMVKEKLKDGVALEEEHIHDVTELLQPIARDTVSVIKSEETPIPISVEIVKEEITTSVTDTVDKSFSTAEIAQLSNEPILESDNLTDDTSVRSADISWQESVKSSLNFTPELYTGQNSFSSIESFQLHSNTSGDTESSVCSPQASSFHRKKVKTSTLTHCYESDTEATTSDLVLSDKLLFSDTTASELTDVETDSSLPYSIKDTTKTMVVDDIKMTDDVIEVTVSTEDQQYDKSNLSDDSEAYYKGKLINTESGSNIVMLESLSGKSICICDSVSSETDFPIDSGSSQPQTRTKPHTDAKKAFKEKSRPDIKPKPKYNSKYDHIESKIKKEFKSSIARKSYKSTTDDISSSSTSTSKNALSPKHRPIERKSNSAGQYKQKPSNNVVEKQQKPEPDIESKDRTSKISEQKYSSRSRGYMASTLSRDMKLESAPKETALKSPKHISKRHKSIERKSESSSTVSTPKTIKIQQSSISSSKHEEISSHKFKALTTMRKREPLKKKVTNSETTKSITLSNKQEKFQSEISKLKHNEKENKIKVSSSGHSKPALTNISSRSTQRLNKSALLPSTDAPLKQKRRLVDQTKQTMTTFKKKDTAESARTDELKTGPSTSSGKDTDSLSKVTKQNTKRLDVTKYQKTFEDTRKASSRDQTFKAQKTQNQLKKSEQTVEIHKSELEDVSTTALPSVSESLSLCSTTIHRSTIVGAESNIDDSLKMRAASAPISSSNIFMDPDIHLSSRRGSGPTRCLISGRIMERHTSLDQSKGPTSLPSSPSRMRSQGQCNSIQLLTSEVFTRTVDSTSGIEVIFHQPNDPVRKPAKSEHYPNDVGETSMIDTTDSSLSDSVALPSSSSDHDLSVDTSYRLRTSISPGSPKISRRSRESMSPKIRQTDIVECATVLEDDTSETEISPDRNSPNLIACDRQLSTPTKLYDKSDNNRAPASSEDRFSPILNVRSITPPRLKHKFVYASSDEEEPSIGKTLLEDESSASNVVMEPSSDHSMLLPSEIPDSSLSETVNTYRPSLVKELDLPLAITDKIVSVQSFEDDFHCEELITETTSSDIDKALLESIKFKSSSEEEATDKDPDPIPSDDILINEIINHHIKDRHQTSLIHNQIMAGKDSSIPLISITNTDENVIHTEINIDPYQKSQDPLTDIEDLDVGPEDRNPRNLKINVIEDGDVTDAEIVEASDDEKDLDCIPKISFQLNDIIDHSGTYEELVRMSSPTSKQSKSNIESSFTTSNTPQLGDFLKLFYERDGTTDYEDMDLSDEEDNADEMGENTENDEVLQRLMDDGTVSISDSVKKSPIPSPSVTPEPGQKRNYKKGKAAKKSSSGLRSKADYNLLSPRSLSPHLSDITDTEVVYSDSDEEERMKKQRPLSPQERRKRLRQLKEIEHDRRKMKDEEERDVLPELEISSVQISEKVPVKEVVSESDTDNTNYVHPKHITYAPKKRTLLMEVAGALMKETLVSTDVEHFEGSNESDDDAASQISEDRTSGTENQFFSIKEKEVSKHALSLPKQDRVVLTDTEDIETEEEFAKASTSKPVIKVSTEASTEEDDFEPTENEYLSAVREMRARAWKDNNYEIHFIEIDGKTRPLAITPDLPVVCHSLKLNTLEKPLYVTDMEDLADSDLETAQNFLPVATVHSDAVLTDTEFVEGDEETFRPKSPEPSDDENSQPLPEPVREMILMKEDPSGRPVSVVLPLGNVSPGGLKPPHLELEGGISEVEDIATDDDDLTNPSFARDLGPTPDLPEIEGGIIHFSEVMKVQKKKLKVTGQEVQEPLTDTEDLFLSVSGKRKRTKTKMKLGLEPTPCNIKQDLTDTEDILLSDVENRQGNILTVPSTEIDPTTDLDDIDISGEEDEHDHQRQMALTPDHLRELGDSYITLKEGNGPFSEEAKQSFLSLHKIPIINTISPSPDIQFLVNTDTEDMFTSADEEGFSRAETITPYEGAIELEDHSSVVYMKHTRKFDLDAPEEAIHVKGGIDIHETLTDIEDLGVSEDERPKPPDQLFVNDTTDQVCVCLTTKTNYEDSVCVCVNKEHGGLALVWNSKNSTDAKHQRDWAEKGGPDSPIDATKREHPSVSLGTKDHEYPDSTATDNSQIFTETVNIETHEHLADRVRDKEAKYHFTMTALNNESYKEVFNSLTVFLENEQEYNKGYSPTKLDEVPVSVNTNVPSSDEAEGNHSKNESDPKSDKSFVGKVSQKILGVFKKDDKGKSKNKNNKNSKKDEHSKDLCQLDLVDESLKETVSETVTISVKPVSSKSDFVDEHVESDITRNMQAHPVNLDNSLTFESTPVLDNKKEMVETKTDVLSKIGRLNQGKDEVKDSITTKQSIDIQIDSPEYNDLVGDNTKKFDITCQESSNREVDNLKEIFQEKEDLSSLHLKTLSESSNGHIVEKINNKEISAQKTSRKDALLLQETDSSFQKFVTKENYDGNTINSLSLTPEGPTEYVVDQIAKFTNVIKTAEKSSSVLNQLQNDIQKETLGEYDEKESTLVKTAAEHVEECVSDFKDKQYDTNKLLPHVQDKIPGEAETKIIAGQTDFLTQRQIDDDNKLDVVKEEANVGKTINPNDLSLDNRISTITDSESNNTAGQKVMSFFGAFFGKSDEAEDFKTKGMQNSDSEGVDKGVQRKSSDPCTTDSKKEMESSLDHIEIKGSQLCSNVYENNSNPDTSKFGEIESNTLPSGTVLSLANDKRQDPTEDGSSNDKKLSTYTASLGLGNTTSSDDLSTLALKDNVSENIESEIKNKNEELNNMTANSKIAINSDSFEKKDPSDYENKDFGCDQSNKETINACSKSVSRETSPSILKSPKSENQLPEIPHKIIESNDEKLNSMLIDMLMEQECMEIPSEELSTDIRSQPEPSTLFELKHDHLGNFSETSDINVLKSEHSFGTIESLIVSPKSNTISDKEKSPVKPYVTTPTMQRRNIGGSQRLSREERPTLREISYLSDNSSSDEETSIRYIVTEPIDQSSSTRKVSFQFESEDETYLKVSDSNSEPDINVRDITSGLESTLGEETKAFLEDTRLTEDIKEHFKQNKNVEKRFERMASETLEADPEVKFTVDKEFQRMVSQLSAEEVEACISQWDEGGMTPSEEQDSSSPGQSIETLPPEEVSKDVTPEQETTEADIIPPKPSPRPTKQDSQDHSNNSQKTNNDIQDYSVRKKFWEQMSSGSQDSQKSQEISPSPVPKPRSSIVSSVPLLKSEAESDTETTATTLSDSTIRIKSLQQDAVSKQSLTGSSESSEKDESETEATENKNSLSDFNIPSTTPFVYNESEVKKHLTRVAENSDSETEYVAKVGDDILTYESSGFILDDEAGQITPKPNDLESSGIGKPVVSSRKGRYERSTSLPTENITDISTSSVKARKQFFETQIKKEMVVDQLMTQLEEESSPEHKSFYHKASDVPTSDPEVMVSRQIHSHIFSHELEEQIESLIPENKQISEQTEEIEPIKSSSVKEVVNTFDKVDAKRCVKRTDSISYEVEIVENKQYSIENVEDLKTDYSKTDKNLKESDNETYNLQIVKHKLTDEFEGFDTSQSKTKIYEEVADIIRYRSDSISKPSESLEVHIDKSEIEESEKEMEIDEELKQLEEGLIQRSKSDLYYRDDEFLPQITVTQSKLRPDSYSQGESEDTQSESDITPEDIREKESVSKFQDWEQEIHSVETLDKNEFCQSPIPPHVHTPEEHIPDTVWEVPIQQEPESSEQEIVEDIPIEKQPILEKDEEESQRSLTESCEMKSEILQRLENSTSHRLSDNESSLTESVLDLKSGVKEQNSECKLTEDEARIIAQEVVENIEIEISKRPQLLTDDIDMNVTSETVDAINNSEVSEYIKRLTGKEDLEVKLIESVLAKKQREQIIKLSRNDTTTSSMEITDEDLRSSGVETDNSPLESQGSRLYPIENNGEDDSTKHIQNNELDLDGVTETSKNKAVLEKTLAEVKESLEAAQDELIEEQKKKKEVHKKPSPSEFEFKALALEKYADAYIQECEIEEAATGFDLEHVVENELNLESSKLSLKEKNEVKNESHADISQSINVVKSEIRIDNRSLDFENKHLTHEETEFIHRTDSSGAKDMKDITKESASYLVCENKDSHLESHQISSFATSAFTSNIDVEQSKEGRGPLEQDFTHSFYKEEHVAEAQLKIGTGNLEKTKCSSISIDKEDTLTFDDNSLKNNYLESKSKDSLMLINETNENYQFESKTQSSTTSGIHQEDSESSLKIKLKNLYLEEEAVVDSVLQKDEIKRTNSEESQKSSQDESFRSHTGIEGGISSSSSSGKKEDSDAAMHTLGQPEVTMRKRKADKSSSHKRSERRSGTDYEPYSSSGESYYQSLEQTSESIRTPSRPCSSDVDALVAGVGTTGSSEYESAFSHEMSARSLTSYEYHTAVSSLSSRDSMKSLDSESSGNLASVEISSEASETLVPSAMELDSDMEGLTMNIIEEDCFFKHKPILEPYDQDIPHHIIKGEPPPRIHTLSDLKEYGKSISLDISSEGGVSEEDGEASLSVSKDEDVLDKSSRMKRSHEMTFQPEPRPITFDVGSESFSCEERLGSSLEDSASIISASSTSDPTAVLTIIERSRTESDKMDGSANSDQLSLTVSGTSEQISLSSVCDDMNVHQIVSCETIATQSLNNESRVESVLLMTSSVNADGIQSVSTQVTSQTEIPPTKIDEIVEDGYTCSNGPTQVEYNAEYDEIKEVKRRPGHRRNESTSFKPSLIPVLKKKDVETKIQKNVTSDFDDDVAESDKYKNVTSLTLKEDRNDEKKDVDETEKVYEESFQTEADQGFHRDMREARQAYEDMSSLEEEHEDLQNITESRPHSQISKSDSESGQRPISSVFSDDRPDSELAELLKQCSSDVCSEDPIERPKTPEPLEDCEIKDDTPEFSSEAQASVTELELEYSGAVSRTLEYEDHVSPIREKVSSHWEHSTLEHEEELAEAEAAFHMVPHVIPHLGGVPHPDTILEDPVAEKHELETREMLLKEEIRKRIAKAEATSPGSIPDITITQHMTPLIDRGFHYPDLELEEADAKASAPQTPASISSRASTETETDQGNEYVLGDDIGEDFITEEPDIGESSVTTEEKTVFESKDDFHERGSATDSPTSDSFEMLEKPDIADEFVIIEEVGKEAHEQDMEGKSMAIGKKRIIKKNVDTEDIVVVSPPAPVTRMTEIKYYPEGGAAFPFESDSPPTNMDGAQSGEGTSQEGSPPSDIEQEYESEVEAGKKWIEMQFQGDQATAVYGYELDYERGPLEDIKEEPDLENNSSRFGSLGSQVSQSAGSFGSMKESFSSTPDYDVLAGRKYFTKSGEHDDVSMSSLQEFERLENLIAMEINRNKSSGSQDSLNSSGNSKRHTGSGKSGGDDVSLASLKEFEGLEHACIEAAKIELKAKEEEAALLSEIEEGHESQASESESCETISAGGIRGGDSDEEDYEKRMFEIDEIIRQAQNNVERFIDVKEKDSLVESSVIEKTESMGRGDSIEEVSKIPDLDLDQPLHSLATTSALTQLHTGPATQQWKEKGSDTIICVSSKHFSDNITTSTDSLEIKTFNERDNMSASTDSIEFQAQQKMLKSKDIMTDSIEVPGDKTSMLTSTDSLETDNAKCFSDSMDDEDGGHNTALQDQSSSSGREGDFSFSSKDDFLEQNRMPPSRSDLLLGSTDSLEPSSSTATNATYHCENDSVMSSSFTSVGSNTLMSSTETLDTGLRTAVWFDDCKPFVTEVIEPCEEGDGFVHTIHRTVEMPPEIHNVTFKGSDADRALKEYIEQFGPGEDVTETQEIDAAGNVHTIRVVQKRVVMKPDDLKNPNSRLSESEIDEYLKLTCDERNTTSESRKETPMFTSSPAQQFLPHQTITQIISQSPKQELISSLVKGETTGEEAEGVPSSAATRETEEALADLAAGIQDNKGSSSGADPSNYK